MMLMEQIVCPYCEGSFIPMINFYGDKMEIRKITHKVSAGGCGEKIKVHFKGAKVIVVERG